MFQALIKVLDFFLPEKILAAAEMRLRARFTVSIFLVAAFFDLIPFVTQAFYQLGLSESDFGWKAGQLDFFGIYFVLNCSCLILIRKSFSLEKVFVGYFFLFTLNFIVDTLLYSQSLLSMSQNFAVAVMTAVFLIAPNPRIRVVVVLVTIANHTICFSIAGQEGIRFIYPPEYYGYFVAQITVFWIVLLAIYLKIKTLTQKELDQEVEWQQRIERLAGITSMTKSMGELWRKPIEVFLKDWRLFLQHQLGPEAGSFADRMQEKLDDIVEVSQSYGWIFRAYRQETSSSVSSEVILHHLQVLLGSKARDDGWILNAHPSQNSFEIYGPIPSIILLLFSAIAEILERPEVEHPRLEIEVGRDKSIVLWKLSWPSGGLNPGFFDPKDVSMSASSLSSPAGNPSQDLIQDLLQSCGAKAHGFRDDGFHYLHIQGAWCR